MRGFPRYLPRSWRDYQNLFPTYPSQSAYALYQWLYTSVSILPEVATWQADGSKYLGVCGDSIMTETYLIAANIQARIQDLQYVNAAAGGSIWQHAPAHLATALAQNPHTVIIGYGINDVSQGNAFGYVEDTEWPLIVSALDASNVEEVIICGITPTSFFDDTKAATSRLWNTYYADWCTENGYTYLDNRAWLGQIRASTGEYDDMRALYSGDTVHPSAVGSDEYAKLILGKMLSGIFPAGVSL